MDQSPEGRFLIQVLQMHHGRDWTATQHSRLKDSQVLESAGKEARMDDPRQYLQMFTWCGTLTKRRRYAFACSDIGLWMLAISHRTRPTQFCPGGICSGGRMRAAC